MTGLYMNALLSIIVGAVLVIMAAFALWRGARKSDNTTYLKNAAVSRQWLMQHQGEDRS